MKGQVFVLFGMLIAILVIYIGSIMHVDMNTDLPMVSQNFLNLRQDLYDKVDSEMIQMKEPREGLNDFLNFTGYISKSKGMEEKAMYCYVFNGTKFTISNFLGENMTNVTIDFNGNVVHLDNIGNGESFTYEFPKSSSYNVNVVYYLNNTENVINFSGYSGRGTADITLYYYLFLGRGREQYKDENLIRRVVWK